MDITGFVVNRGSQISLCARIHLVFRSHHGVLLYRLSGHHDLRRALSHVGICLRSGLKNLSCVVRDQDCGILSSRDSSLWNGRLGMAFYHNTLRLSLSQQVLTGIAPLDYSTICKRGVQQYLLP